MSNQGGRVGSMDKEGAVLAVINQQDFTNHSAPTAQAMSARQSRSGRGLLRQLSNSSEPAYTPTGGSACQQSSRALMWTLLAVTVVIIAIAGTAFDEVKATYDAELAMLTDFNANASVASDADFALWVAAHDAELAAGANPDDLCDARFFANKTDSLTLVDTVDLLDVLMGVFYGLGVTAAVIFLIVKTCVTYSLSVTLNQDDGHKHKGEAPVLESIVVGGDPETRAERRTRVYLRSETVGYMFVQGLMDVPLVTLCLLYYLLRSSNRGSRCAECFLQREVCTVDGFADLPTSVTLALFAVCISLLWNFGLLMERWIQFVKWKRYKLHGDEATVKYYVATVIFSAMYVLIIVAPMALLIHYEFAPFFAQVADPDALRILGLVGTGMWGLVSFVLLFVAGLEAGELCACPLLFCEVCEVFCDPLLETCGCCQGLCCC